MASKFYVVWKGRQPGVYATWDEAKAQVEGFPGAQYTSVKNETLAQAAFIGSSRNSSLGSKAISSPYESELRERSHTFISAIQDRGFSAQIIETSLRDHSIKIKVERDNSQIGNVIVYYSPNKGTFRAEFSETNKANADLLQELWYGGKSQPGHWFYVDGSFLEESKGVGWSVVIILDGIMIDALSGCIDEISMNQVSGELEAAKRAVLWCKEHGVTEATIAHDYEGVGKWATGEWKAKNAATASYAEFMRTNQNSINLKWQKVDAHSGDRWNEQVDKLAKQACK